MGLEATVMGSETRIVSDADRLRDSLGPEDIRGKGITRSTMNGREHSNFQVARRGLLVACDGTAWANRYTTSPRIAFTTASGRECTDATQLLRRPGPP